MTLKLCILSFLILMTGAISQARAETNQNPVFGSAKKIARMLAKTLATESAWTSLDSKELRIIVQDVSNGNLYAVGFSAAELSQYSPKTIPGENYFQIFLSYEIPKVDFFTVCEDSSLPPKSCAINEEGLWTQKELEAFQMALLPLVRLSGKPILLMANHSAEIANSPVSFRRKMFSYFGKSSAEKFAVFQALHEVFHAQQERLFSATRELFDLSSSENQNCSQSPAVRKDLSRWAALNQFRFTLTKFDFRAKVLEALNLRTVVRKSGNHCFELSYRSEGTANYFAANQMVSAGLITSAESVHFINTAWLSVKNARMSYYDYGYGPIMGGVLDRLDPDKKWQQEIDQGKPFEDVLRARLNL